jgi:hypothetical protein
MPAASRSSHSLVGIEAHPYTAIFPDMAPEEFAAFKADISANGVREPVWIWRGKLIDGRHRQRACRELGIECSSQEWKGKECDLLAFMVSVNFHRRNFTEGQRAMIAEKLANLPPHRPSKSANLPTSVSQPVAAKLLNVSERSVRSAKVVRSQGVPELVEAVETGRMAVSAAAEVARLPAQQQRAVIAEPPARRASAHAGTPRLENDPDRYIRRVKGGKFQARPIDEDGRHNLGLFPTMGEARKAIQDYYWGRRGERAKYVRFFSKREGPQFRIEVPVRAWFNSHQEAEAAVATTIQWVRDQFGDAAEDLPKRE